MEFICKFTKHVNHQFKLQPGCSNPNICNAKGMQVDTTNGWIGMCNLQGYKFVSSQCPTAVAPQKPTQILWTWTFHGVHLAHFQKQHLVVMRNPISITLPRNEQSAQEFLSKSKTGRLKITGSKKSSVCPRGPLRQRLLMRFPAAKMWTFFLRVYLLHLSKANSNICSGILCENVMF